MVAGIRSPQKFYRTLAKRLSAVSYNAHVIAKSLLEILVCPECKQPLEYRQNPESLKCVQCHRVYAVKDDIPIMLIDEATLEP
jgi:LSD1 subclass zinc finger protein